MADYDSGYTGPQIDAGIGLAGTALQPADRFGGWAQYQDSVYTDVARETVNLEVRTPYTVDGLLPASNTDHLDTVPSTIWNGITMQPNMVGEAFSARIDFKAAPNAAGDGYLTFELDIGSGASIDIVQRRFQFSKGSGITHDFSAGFPIFALDTFLANGGKFYLTSSINCEIWGRRLFIQRTYRPFTP